ncbi:MAG: hypothetical protein IPM51_06975 [Sphingobacteriaceae bacterium]|nr:hypothetical protein [Sphingobacteriaceae bacterium]
MRTKTIIICAPFKEYPVAEPQISIPGEFEVSALDDQPIDFTVNGKFNLQQYCHCLLYKLLSLPKSKIKPFLQFQCSLLNDPFVWLNKLEKLIDLNRDGITTKDHNIKIEKSLMVIELLRQEIESEKFMPAVRYNFSRLKQKLKNYQSIEEKLSCLLEAKTEYLQNRPHNINSVEVPFNEKCDLEITLLKNQLKLKKKSVAEKSIVNIDSKKKPVTLNKLQINSNLNLVVDVFYQLMYEKRINGRPIISGTPNEVAEMISKMFIDKEGNEISQETVKTILKPSRIEKRPKGNVRLDVL